jgi:soluble lytic murein transglycosylase-like protein
MMAASPMRAAGPASGTAPAPRQIVVRVDSRTGKLVRTAAPQLKPASPSKPKPEIAAIVEHAASENQVDPLLVHSIIQEESNFNPYAISSKGAEGLMQLMPPTARMLGVANSFDPRQNIEAGVRYLKQLQDIYHDDRLALAAYNAGPAAVDKYKQVPPYKETQEYVNRVGSRYTNARTAAEPKAATKAAPQTETAPEAVSPVKEKQTRLEQFVDQDGRLHLRTVSP